MTYTLLEEQFFPYPWCQRLLRGLNEEARKKRIEITQLTNLEEKPSEFGCVLLIGATSSWVNTMAEKARAVRCVQLRKHSMAREKRYSFGYAVSFIFACYQILWTFPKSQYLCSRYLPLVCG